MPPAYLSSFLQWQESRQILVASWLNVRSRSAVTRIFAFAILLAVVSCGSSLDEKTEALVRGKNSWLSQVGTAKYKFDLRKDCFCTHDGQTLRLSVEDGAVVHVQIAPDSLSDGTEISRFRPTMRELFDLILELTQRELESDGTLDVEYDQALGYPTLISWTGDGMDGYLVVTISNVVTD